jgi:hypothetical protein
MNQSVVEHRLWDNERVGAVDIAYGGVRRPKGLYARPGDGKRTTSKNPGRTSRASAILMVVLRKHATRPFDRRDGEPRHKGD